MRRPSETRHEPWFAADERAEYSLRFNGGEVAIDREETFIGRGDDCQVQLKDSLTSRRHAVLLYRAGTLEIEDLGSSNGTFVNRKRVHGRMALLAGDCVYIGAGELCVLRRTEAGVPSSHLGGSPAEEEPSSAVRAVNATSEDPLPGSHARTIPALATDGSLERLLGLSDLAFEERQIDATATIFSSHVKHVLEVAQRGEPVDSRVVDTVGRYSVKLCRATREAHWLEKAILLHHVAARPLREGTLLDILSLIGGGLGCDRALLRDYVDRLREEAPSMAPEERYLVERAAALAATGF